MVAIFIKFFILLILFYSFATNAENKFKTILNSNNNFFKKNEEGWFWYKDPILQEEELIDLNNKKPTKIPETYKEQIYKINEELEEILAEAIIKPTIGNVKAYQILQKKLIDRAVKFADIWEITILQNPDIDDSIRNPISQKGINVKRAIDEQNREIFIKSILDNYGLVYFFDSRCIYSREFAKVITLLQLKYEVDVKSISVDGKDIIGLLSPIRGDNGLSKVFNVKNIPSLYLVHPQNKEIILISSGYKTLDIVEDNIFKIVNFHFRTTKPINLKELE
jgi:conjugal transfer pilus assembly protein TraF